MSESAIERLAERHKLGARLSLSDITWLLLTRPTRDHSSVTLSRNAKGETQIEVVVRTGEEGIDTALDAERAAKEIYERLRATYPLATGAVTAGPPAPARTRAAK